MSESTNMISGVSRPIKVTNVVVSMNDERIKTAAEVSTTVILQKTYQYLGATREDVLDVNVVGLKAALIKAMDGTKKLDGRIMVPVYFDAMTRGFEVKTGRLSFRAKGNIPEIVVPDNYMDTVMKLKAAGVPFVRPHRPADESSSTLLVGVETIDNVECATGNSLSICVEDIVRRSLIEYETTCKALMCQMLGDLGISYGGIDNLITDYFTAQTKTVLK